MEHFVWTASPEIFNFENLIFGRDLTMRWYGLFFAIGFGLGYKLMSGMYQDSKKSLEDLDDMLVYLILGTVLGARLGHCLFYQPDFYLANPMEILYIWKGGLASHGGAIGVPLAMYIYSKRHKNQPFMWVLDRVAVTVPLVGFLIRMGNFMNSEIVGKATDLPWGVVFARNGEDFARHPAQVYEALSYLFIFVVIKFTYNKTKENTPNGKLFGMFMMLIFGFRFFMEFLKENQVGFEEGLPLNMGQLLSIPLVLLGAYFYKKSQDAKLNPKNF
jgi:prolipoprotein diacylglyceryl transferase